MVILSSCSKEDDLLTPVTNPTNTTQVNDSTTYTVTGGDSTVLCPWDAEYVHDESLTTTTNNGTLVLEGSKYRITYSSFYLRNKTVCCPFPNGDTTVFNEWYNQGEVYFSNHSGGYIHSQTLPWDWEDPTWNVALAPGVQNEQPMVSYTLENNKIVGRIYLITMNGNVMDYTVTFDIVSYTDNTLIIENRTIWFMAPNHAMNTLGYDCERTVRLELEKIN